MLHDVMGSIIYGSYQITEFYCNAKKMGCSPMETLSLTKEARIYNGLKTISLRSGAGKTGQPLVKEWN